jgi:hypothetical protein
MKDAEAGECPLLRESEAEVEIEMREWGRQRLEAKLQAQADRHGRIFPPQRPACPAPAPPDPDPAHHGRGD